MHNINDVQTKGSLYWRVLLLLLLLMSYPTFGVPDRAYVPNLSDGTISVIDTTTNGVVTTIVLPIGSTPFGIAITPDGTRAYVTRVPSSSEVGVIDLATNTLLTSISPFLFPGAIAITPDGTYAYVLSLLASSHPISVIDTKLNTVSTTILFPPVTTLRALAITPDSKRVYVSGGNHIWYIENNIVSSPIIIPSALLERIAITPDGSRAYITDDGNQAVAVLDTTTNTVVTSIPLPLGSDPIDIAITPDGTLAFVTNNSNSTVGVINTQNNTLETLILMPTSGPWAIAITPDGLNAYLTDITNNVVWAINTITKAVTGPIAVGIDPESIAITPAPLPPPPPPPPVPPSPTNVSGQQQTGADSGLEKEYVNSLRWAAEPNAVGVIGYLVFRNGTQIAELNASTFHYVDHNQKKGASVTYSVVSLSDDGQQSAPITIVIH